MAHPAAAVFNTFELVEMILWKQDIQTLLFTQRGNRTCHYVVKDSETLQRTLCYKLLSDDGSRGRKDLAINPPFNDRAFKVDSYGSGLRVSPSLYARAGFGGDATLNSCLPMLDITYTRADSVPVEGQAPGLYGNWRRMHLHHLPFHLGVMCYNVMAGWSATRTVEQFGR